MYLKISIILILVFSFVFVSGCTLFQPISSTPFTIHGGNQNTVQIILSLSNAPKLSETMDILLAPNIHYLSSNESQSIDNSRAWLEFTWTNIHGSYSEAETAAPISLDEVRVKGDLSWQGAIKIGETIEVHSTVKLPREGVWAITGYFTGEGWQKPVTAQMRVAVTKDAAAIIGTPAFYHSPLVYLGYIGYGQAYTLGKPAPSEANPVLIHLDISKAPQPGEESVLTCNINSFYDLSDFPVQVTFFKRVDANNQTIVPGDKLLVNGSLNWTGNINKGANQVSASIKFPEEGDWEIHVQSDYPLNGQPGFADNLRLHVVKQLSYFGWKDRP
jgi:hypothetical protein